jgi:hypothetical protein
LPEAQAPPSALLHEAVDTAGWQLWQELLGSTAPLATSFALSQQPAVHELASQTSPVPQLAPLARAVHAVVEVEGWQTWQALAALAAPLA